MEDVLQDVYQRLVEEPAGECRSSRCRPGYSGGAEPHHRSLPEKRPESLEALAPAEDDGGGLALDDLLPSPDAGPAARYDRALLLDALEEAIDDLPDEQRQVFVGHELEGRSFKEMAATTGTNMNTLLARKRYAVRRLRERLADIYADYREEIWTHEEIRWLIVAAGAAGDDGVHRAGQGSVVMVLWNSCRRCSAGPR
jgi:hypothetical protein